MTAGLYIGQLIFSGVFDRHPSLHFCFAETRIGWAPFWLSWADRQVSIGRVASRSRRNQRLVPPTYAVAM